MALEPLATVADLSARGITITPELTATTLLASVSAAVREAAGVPISQTVSDVTLMGSREQWLPLPFSPVTTVADVSISGVAVTDFLLADGRLWRSNGWQAAYPPSLVTLTVTHGYAVVPADIVTLVCAFVAAGAHAINEGVATNRGVSSERVDDYQISFTRGEDEVVDMTELPERTRAMLRRRFSPGAEVTGSF